MNITGQAIFFARADQPGYNPGQRIDGGKLMTVISTVGPVILLTLSFAGTANFAPFPASGAQTDHSDQARLRALIDNLIDSYRKEDLAAHNLLWAADSPELADQNSSLKQFFETYDQIGILDEKILRLSILGHRAGARVSYRVRAIDAGTGRPLSGDAVRYETIICRRDGSDWKILSIRSTASLVMEQVLKSDNDVERHRLLDAEREWLTSSSIIEEGRNLLAGGRSGEAHEIATLVMNRSEKDGDIAGQIGALELLSAVNAEKGDRKASVDDLKRILTFDKVKGSNAEAGRIWNEIGKVHNRFGDYRAAAEAFELALGLREKTGDQIQIAILQNNLGSMYRMLGNYRRAMELLNRCLINSKSRARALYFRALINLGNVYGAQGNHELALKSYLESIRISEEMGSLNDVATTWNNIGTVYSAQRRYQEALDAYQRSRQVHESIQNERGAATAIHNIGSLHLHRNQYDEALPYLMRGLELREKHQNVAHIASSLTSIGRAWHGKGEFAEALKYLSRAVDLARRSGDQDLLRRCLTQAGETSLATGQDAAGSFTEAIGIIERIRTSVAGPPRDLQLFFENKLDPYRGMLRLSVSQNRHVEAFEYAERARARVLLDVLRDESRLDPAHTGFKSPRGIFSPLTQTEAMRLLPDRSYALLEFSISEAGSFLLVLTRDEHDASRPRLEVFPIRTPSATIEEKTALFRRQLSERDPGFARLAIELYQILLKPAEAALSGKTRLVIVPDGCLWEMPFQALMPAEDRFLIESASIFLAPSLTALSNMIRLRSDRNSGNRKPGSLLGIGNPAWDPVAADQRASFEPLPEAERQVREIEKLYGSGKSLIFTGRAATESNFKSEARNHDILHLATHGVVDDASPLYSYLLLARSGGDEDGLLEAREVMNLDLKARLAVLSACETARGHIGAGEGVVGLAWSFFIAGVPSIAVSQWKVRSDSTADLMIEFHRRLAGKVTGNSSPVAEALRDASLKVMKMKGYRHPFYWAGFILVGDGY